MRRHLELSRRGNVTFTQGIEPAVGIANYSVNVVILQLDDLWCVVPRMRIVAWDGRSDLR
jgi:hypothetical protein